MKMPSRIDDDLLQPVEAGVRAAPFARPIRGFSLTSTFEQPGAAVSRRGRAPPPGSFYAARFPGAAESLRRRAATPMVALYRSRPAGASSPPSAPVRLPWPAGGGKAAHLATVAATEDEHDLDHRRHGIHRAQHGAAAR